MLEPRIRPARPGDGPGCADIWLEVGRHYSSLDPAAFQVPSIHGLAESFERDIAEAGPEELRLVADHDGVIGGLLVAVLQTPGPRPEHELVLDLARPRLYIQILAVAESRRRTGVGTALMTAAETWARAQGVATVALNTWMHSPTSVPFYERRMGYSRRAIVFRKDLDPPSH